MPLEALDTLLFGAVLGIPGWVLAIGCGLAALVTRRAGWVHAEALFAIGPLVYFAATPRFQYVAPVGIVLAIVAVLMLRRKGDVRVAAALATMPLVVILAWMLVSAAVTGQL